MPWSFLSRRKFKPHRTGISCQIGRQIPVTDERPLLARKQTFVSGHSFTSRAKAWQLRGTSGEVGASNPANPIPVKRQRLALLDVALAASMSSQSAYPGISRSSTRIIAAK
jgi:hypothetical protein